MSSTNTSFLNPTTIACIIIAAIYLLPWFPYLSVGDKKGSNSMSISGLQLLIGDVSLSVEDLPKKDREKIEDELEENVEKVLYKGYSGKDLTRGFSGSDISLQPMFGWIDKLTAVVFLCALVLIYLSYKRNNDAFNDEIEGSQSVSPEGERWILITLFALGLMLMMRYMLIPIIVFPVNMIWSVGSGAIITTACLVVIYFSNKLK